MYSVDSIPLQVAQMFQDTKDGTRDPAAAAGWAQAGLALQAIIQESAGQSGAGNAARRTAAVEPIILRTMLATSMVAYLERVP